MLVQTKQDLDLALDLFEKEMRMKSKILSLDRMMIESKDVISLYNRILNDYRLTILDKKLSESMVKGRKQD